MGRVVLTCVLILQAQARPLACRAGVLPGRPDYPSPFAQLWLKHHSFHIFFGENRV